MYNLNKDKNSKLRAVNLKTSEEVIFDTTSEGLLASLHEDINKKIKGNGIVAKTIKGTVHFTFWLFETSMRRRRYLRGEENPEERTFKL